MFFLELPYAILYRLGILYGSTNAAFADSSLQNYKESHT